MYQVDSIETIKKINWFIPSDWKYRASFPLKFKLKMISWIRNNCSGSWRLDFRVLSGLGEIRFSRMEDAMAYKLRWM